MALIVNTVCLKGLVKPSIGERGRVKAAHTQKWLRKAHTVQQGNCKILFFLLTYYMDAMPKPFVRESHQACL